MTKAVVSLSGGLDSTTVLAAAIGSEREVIPVFFNYGSKHNTWELRAAKQVCQHYGLDMYQLQFSGIIGKSKSSLMNDNKEIPEGHYEAKTMEDTVVPARNIIFASILAGFAWERDASEVWMGVHSGDHAIYPDCRPEFLYHMNKAIQVGTDCRVSLMTPFMDMTKAEILERGLRMEVPYELTRTCYSSEKIACGKCGADQERLEAFMLNKTEDPIKYVSREIFPK
jgi:7-cyano-7-deazaguanine synthase